MVAAEADEEEVRVVGAAVGLCVLVLVLVEAALWVEVGCDLVNFLVAVDGFCLTGVAVCWAEVPYVMVVAHDEVQLHSCLLDC